MSKTPLLDFYQTRLDDLELEYKSVLKQLRVEQDGTTQIKLERRIEQIGCEMSEWQQKIDSYQAEQQRQEEQLALDTLITIFNSYENQLELMVQAYQQTISHWPVSVRPNVETVDTIIWELQRISPGQSPYTAQEEFIAYVVYQTSEPSLASALNQWGVQYCSGKDWLQLHEQIQVTQSKRLENAQPAILIKITRSDEASTQSQDDETYYQLNAWIVEDVETYRERKTGYYSLVSTGSPEAAPLLLENLLQNITDLLNRFLVQQRQVCESCQNFPQIHIFLPLELMHLGVDVWPLRSDARRQESLGHNHEVFIRCTNRYDGNYSKRPIWLKLWKRHQGLLQELTRNTFILGHDSDLDALMDLLDVAVNPENSEDSNVVGLHVSQAPLSTEELVYELLDSGLPLAIWPRRNLADQAHEVQLADLLAACCLERLPHTVKNKRRETRRRENSPERHIGHHLSLLWDDPFLVPPKTA